MQAMARHVEAYDATSGRACSTTRSGCARFVSFVNAPDAPDPSSPSSPNAANPARSRPMPGSRPPAEPGNSGGSALMTTTVTADARPGGPRRLPRDGDGGRRRPGCRCCPGSPDLQPERGVAALIGDGRSPSSATFDDELYALDNQDPFTGARAVARHRRQPRRRPRRSPRRCTSRCSTSAPGVLRRSGRRWHLPGSRSRASSRWPYRPMAQVTG